MIHYNNQILTKIENKKAGKNRSTVDGFYSDKKGREYFIKKPADKKELFTELLAALFFKEFISRGLIKPQYIPSLIHADLIQFEDGTYGLIQPKVSFTELYKIIGTGFRDGSDRDPFFEMRHGPTRYPILNQQGPHFGLSTALMFSLLFGDHSVHSGNVVVLNSTSGTEPAIKQFARIDWGASFRYYAHPDNNRDNLFDFYQYQRSFKRFTQGYFDNYKNISGLFSAMGDRAQELGLALKNANVSMNEIVTSALSQIPEDLLDPKTQASLAEYMATPCFATTKFGPGGDFQALSEVFSSILDGRLMKISALTENDSHQIYSEADANSLMYQSFRALEASIPVTIKPFITLPEQLELLENTVKTNANLDFSQIDLTELTRQFNRYVKYLAQNAERVNLWRHSSDINLFASYLPDEQTAVLDIALPLKEYRESAILERLYTLDLETLDRLNFAPYEQAVQAYSQQNENKDSAWLKIERNLTLGLQVISDLRQLKIAQSSSEQDVNNAAELRTIVAKLQGTLPLFLESQRHLNELLQDNSITIDSNLAFRSRSFYFISDEILQGMHSHQLITICLEELYSAEPSPLVARIIKDDFLWERISKGYSQENFNHRPDNPQGKFAKLAQWRQALEFFYFHKMRFDEGKNLEDMEAEFASLQISFQELPAFLKSDSQLMEELLSREALLTYWQKEQTFLNTKATDAHKSLELAFATLPSHLKQEFDQKILSYQKEMSFLQQKQTHQEDTILSTALVSFNLLKEAFNELPNEIKASYQNEIESLQKRIDDWQAHQNYIEQENIFLRGTAEEKIDAYKTLRDNFAKLSVELQVDFQQTMDEYSRENDYLEQRANYQKQEIVGIKLVNFDLLKCLFDQLSNTQKQSYHEDFANLWRRTLCYEQIVKEQIAKDTENTLLIDTTLDRLNTGRPDAELLITAATRDKKLWEALINCPNAVLTQELVQDLLAIQKFYTERVVPTNDVNFGVEYNESLTRFYENTLRIRLSETPIKTQAQEITALAHQEFIPRHKTERQIIDVLMLISILFAGLGAFIMLGRYCTNRPAFFSHAVTNREADLKNMLKSELSDEDTSLFTIAAPAA